MNDINYKAVDTRKIVDYLKSCPGNISVENIIRFSGADRLRVYPALFELEQSGFIEIVEREELGAPLAVRRRRDASTSLSLIAGVNYRQVTAVILFRRRRNYSVSVAPAVFSCRNVGLLIRKFFFCRQFG